MNTYMIQILQLLISNNGELSCSFLSEQFKISRRMISYYLKQLDEWRKVYNIPEISMIDDRLALKDSLNDAQEWLEKFKQEFNTKDYVLNANERQDLLILLIGISKNQIGIDYLIEFFNVSKNTIISDLASVKRFLANNNVGLKNKLKSGYYLDGNEQTIRYILMCIFHHHENVLLQKLKKQIILESLKFDKTENLFEQILEILHQSEKYGNERFVFLALRDLADTIILILARQTKCKVDIDIEIPKINLNVLEYIVEKFKAIHINLEEGEQKYLYVLLQSAKVSKFVQYEFEEEVMNLTKDIIAGFKYMCRLNVFEKNEVYDMFLIHMKSMYYRMKYKIKITNFEDTFIQDIYGFYNIAKIILDGISRKYDLVYDEDEVKYLSYYFASLEYVNEPLNAGKDNIIIVCVSGLGGSMYLKSQCLKLFDSSLNVKITDLRNLQNNLDENTRLIISTVKIDDSYTEGIEVKNVHPVLTFSEKQDLIEWFLKNHLSLSKEEMLIHDILGIIKENTVIKDQQKLYKDLNCYFKINQNNEIRLEDIFSEENIKIIKEVNTWQDLVYEAGEPIVNSGVIDKSYLEDIIAILNIHGPYCECFDGILVAHAIPNENVKFLILSLAVSQKPIEVKEWGKRITAIFILGVVDTELHGNAFAELIHNLAANNLYKRLSFLETPNDVFKEILQKN